MNVLIMADYRTPNSGNFVASLLELAEKMQDQGNKVVFLFPDNGKGGYSWSKWLEENGFSVILCHIGNSEQELTEELSAIVRDHQVELIHSHFGCCHKVLIKNRRKLGNVQVLIHDHMDFSPEGNLQKQQIKTMLCAVAYRLAGIGVVSVMQKKSKTYWLAGKKNWYVPNGLSLKRNIPQSMERSKRRQQLNVDEEEKLCLFLGWDMHRKGVDIAIKAVDYLRQRGRNICLGLVGFGNEPLQQVREWILHRTNVDPNSEWIRFFPSAEDMFSYHRAADVYLSASRKEAFSYGILEAMSQNTPVVMSDIEGTQWAAKYNKCIQYPVENAVACADALETALDLENERSNKDEIMEYYSIDIWCQRIIDIYYKMLNK